MVQENTSLACIGDSEVSLGVDIGIALAMYVHVALSLTKFHRRRCQGTGVCNRLYRFASSVSGESTATALGTNGRIVIGNARAVSGR